MSSVEVENILMQAQQGKSLHDKTICWTDKSTGFGVIFVKARDLEIAFSDNRQYWKWYGFMSFEVAELLGGCVLDVCGKLDMSRLEVNKIYKVSFIVMMKDDFQGWGTPVTLGLRAGGATTKEDVVLDKLPRNCPVLLPVGEFKATEKGTVEFYMIDRQCLTTRKGLVIGGAVVRGSPIGI